MKYIEFSMSEKAFKDFQKETEDILDQYEEMLSYFPEVQSMLEFIAFDC